MAETANTENPTPEETLDEPVAESPSRESDEDFVNGKVPERGMSVRESVAGGAKDMWRKVVGTSKSSVWRRILPIVVTVLFIIALIFAYSIGVATQQDKAGTYSDRVVIGAVPSAAQVAEVVDVPDLRLNSSSASNAPSTAKVSFNSLSGKCDGAFNVDARSRASSHAEFRGLPKGGSYSPIVNVDVYSLSSWKAAETVIKELSGNLNECQEDVPQTFSDSASGTGAVTSLSTMNPIYADITYAPRGKCTNVIGHATSALYVISACGEDKGVWAHQAALAIVDILNSNVLQLQRFE